MMTVDCNYVRDSYPDVLNQRVAAGMLERIRVHIAGCDECRGEIALLEAIYAERPQVSARVYERVFAGMSTRRERPRYARRALALAAVLGAVAIGGTRLLQMRESTGALNADIGLVGVDAVMMTGKTSLGDLSVEQLETLLREMES